mgnify:CR=1 FL=1
MIRTIKQLYRSFLKLVSSEIWKDDSIEDKTVKGRLFAFLRICSITFDGMIKNNLFSRAAALSYSSLIGLGPMLVVVVLISGSFLKGNQEDYIKKVLVFVAPTLEQYNTLEEQESGSTVTEQENMSSALDDLITQITEGAEKMAGSISHKGGGVAGLVGMLTLIFIGIQLITAIENTFNHMWGATQGRSWWLRIVFYWTFISMGTLLGLGSLTLFSASTIVGYFNVLPFSESLTHLFTLCSPVISFFMLVALLGFCYQFFPNVKVRMKPAFTGAFVVAILLVINNLASILYINIVIRTQNLYGSVAIIPVLMVGLYFFWVFVLLGGQFTYALQNMNYLVNQQMWNNISLESRETLMLSSLISICRNFYQCKPPISATQLSSRLRTPSDVLNESLSRLETMGWIQNVPVADGESTTDTAYVPAKPLSKITLNTVIKSYNTQGNNEGSKLVLNSDELVKDFRVLLDHDSEEPVAKETFENLFRDHEDSYLEQ